MRLGWPVMILRSNLHWSHALIASVLCAAACNKSEPTPPPAPQEDPAAVRLRTLKEAQARIEAEREKKREELRAVGEAVLTDKKVVGKKGSEKIELEFELENKSDKPLVMAEGTIVLHDAEGNALRKLKVPFTQEIAPGKSAKKRGVFPLDPASDADHALAKMPEKQLHTEWIVSLYRYADGTELRGE